MWRRIRSAMSELNGKHPQDLPNSSDQPTAFQYCALKEPHKEIRLIRILNVIESPDASIRPILEIEMFHTSLANAESYVAVSYAWGDPKPVCKFICNGSELYAPANTFRALYTVFHASRNNSTSLYREGETPTLWIDALCINQRDVAEKNFQVPMMGSIYQRSTGAIGYVRSPGEGTDPINAITSMAVCINPALDLPLRRDMSS